MTMHRAACATGELVAYRIDSVAEARRQMTQMHFF